MRFLQKSVAAAAVIGLLALAPRASAQFTPPSSIAPYLPAANPVTVNKIASFGTYSLYSCSMGGNVVVPSSYTVAMTQVVASSNCSWKAFVAATVQGSNGAAVVQAQNWWNANINYPYYNPLFLAAKNAGAKAAAIQAGAVRRR
jgi:hypothetical protein